MRPQQHTHTSPRARHHQIVNDIERAKKDVAAAKARQAELAAQLQQAKAGKEDSVRCVPVHGARAAAVAAAAAAGS